MTADSLDAGAQPSLERFHQVHAAMGTEFAIGLYAPDDPTAASILLSAFDDIDRLEDILSNYKPSSELSRRTRSRTRTQDV